MELLFEAIPLFVITMLAERWLLRGAVYPGYAWPDTLASLAMGIGNLVVRLLCLGLTVAVFSTAWQHRLWELQTEAGGPWWTFVLLFFAEDLVFYGFHRASHEVRLLWASHVNHHSSERYNLSTALRQPWTSPLFAVWFWAPLAWLGFHPVWIATASAISLLYQYGLHTELVRTLGPLEFIFNTPSHHRVHHAVNARYLDRNHGGVLIVWDRLFGTFEPEAEAPVYGIRSPLRSFNPVVIAFHDLVAMAREVMGARTWRGRVGYVFGPPGWTEDGPQTTSAAARREAGL